MALPRVAAAAARSPRSACASMPDALAEALEARRGLKLPFIGVLREAQPTSAASRAA
jgi:hypothetical protein